MTQEEFNSMFLIAQNTYGQAIEDTSAVKVIDKPEDIEGMLSLPGVEFDDDGNVTGYAQVHYKFLADALAAMQTATTDAGTATEGAEGAAETANTAAENAERYANYAREMTEHPMYVADGTSQRPGDVGYVYEWDFSTSSYVRGARLSLDYDSMSQAEKDALAQSVLDNLTFASAATCASIVDELQ